jgi:(2Fe-2S) ferredoxin
VDSRPGLESVRRTDLRGLSLTDLDPQLWLDSGDGEAFDGPLILVCTHGTRDACCAKWGRAVFQAFEALEPDRVRQSSHLTGHRFAPVVAVLPQGVVYGRVQPGDAAAILESARKNQIWDLDRFRGRSCDPAPVQAAEKLLRRKLGELGLDALHPVECSLTGDEARVLFESASGSQLVELRREVGPSAPSSCGAPSEPSVRWVPLP